jgi:hypothetical protein
MVQSMRTRDRQERGPEGQQVIHREHRDGRVDAIVQVAPINVKARARVVDISVSEKVETRSIESKADIRRPS